MPFKLNDIVKPIPSYATDITLASGTHKALPSGRVREVIPYDKGQLVRIEGHGGAFPSGCFELVESADAGTPLFETPARQAAE